MADNVGEVKCNRDWEGLPKDILEAILSYLYGEDVRSFHLVCRSWYAAEEYLFQKEHNPVLMPETQSQWLLHKQCSQLTYQFIHPVYPNVRYAKNLLEETEKGNDDAVVRHSKDGWLLMSKDLHTVFFFSPFPNKVVIKLPDLPSVYEFDGVAFSCAPTSSTDCCVIFGISCVARTHVDISTIRLGKKKWKSAEYENNILFRPSYSNPVFYKEMFYCLSLEGNLGTYDYRKDRWTVLENPLSPRKWAYENYLVVHDGGLMSLFMGNSGSWVFVFKLKEPDMVWENVYSLEEYALFVSLPTAFATRSVLDMMKNKIFFSWLHNNYPVFYCLETKTFRTYGSDLCGKNLYRSEIAKQLESSWIEPREICCQEEQVLDETYDEYESDEETDDESEYDEGTETNDEAWEDDDYETGDELSYEEEEEKAEKDEINNNKEYEAIHEYTQEETEEETIDMTGRRKGASSSPPNAQSCPWLMFSHGKSNIIQTFYSIADNRCLKRMLPHLSEKTIHANCDGWMVITGYSEDGNSLPCFVLHIISMEKILLPNLEDIEYPGTCLLSSSPLKPNCVVAFISSTVVGEGSRIKLWRPTQENWVEVVIDHKVSNLIMCEGKIYGIQNYELVTVDMHDNDIQITRQIRLPSPSIWSVRENEFLIESCGEFFVIFQFKLGVVGQRTRALQVYKLVEDKNTRKMDWTRITDIGDRAFFVNNRLNDFSCSATQAGLKGNSIYFTGLEPDTHIHRYSLLENRIYETLPCQDVANDIRQICWLMIHQPSHLGI